MSQFKKCFVEGCERKHFAKDYCHMHYRRLWRYGTVELIKNHHGMSTSNEYEIWCGMIRRCNNINYYQYHLYGGRGIYVCDEWCANFENFYRDMGPRPSKKHSIDRIDSDGPYAVWNCRWATWDIQANNRRLANTGIKYKYKGKLLTIKELSSISNLKGQTIYLRIKKGWDVESAVDRPLLRRGTVRG